MEMKTEMIFDSWDALLSYFIDKSQWTPELGSNIKRVQNTP